jgi:hypothetical protein
MRRLLSAFMAAALLAACSTADSVSGPSLPIWAQGLGNDPDRIRVHEHHTEPFSAPAMGCVEPMLVTGTVHVILYAQDNPADRVHYLSHTNLQGVSAVGQVTGTSYRLAQVFNAVLNYVAFLDPPKFETNQVFRYRVIGQRPQNNFWFDVSYHLTVTPDGRVSSSFIRVEGRCAEEG